MHKFVLRRLLYMVLMIALMSLLLFAMSRVRGDPRTLYMNEWSTEEDWEAWGKMMGLDRPLVVQYLIWISKAVRGDFGESILYAKPAISVVATRFPATLMLGGVSFLFVIALAVPLGVLSATRRGSVWDYVARGFALVGQAAPPFYVGILFIIVFGVELHWLPTGRRGDFRHFILPVATLGWASAAGMLRLIRSSMLEVLDSEYIKLARAKGVRPWAIVFKHALKNASIAPLTYAGLILAGFITGTVVVETVFVWPGLGRLGVEAISGNDYPVMVAVVSFFTVLYVGIALIIDLLYAVADPRIRYD